MLTKAEAQDVYRRAWLQRCLAQTFVAAIAAEQVMDAVQIDCVDGGQPGIEWENFVRGLPGFCEFWERAAAEYGVTP